MEKTKQRLFLTRWILVVGAWAILLLAAQHLVRQLQAAPSSAEVAAPAALPLGQTAKPFAIPFSKSAIDLDAFCDREQEYGAAAFVTFADAFAGQGQIFLQHDEKYLYICLMAVAAENRQRFASVYLDTDHGQEEWAEEDDLSLRVRFVDGGTESLRGTGVQNGYKSSNDTGWSAAAGFGNADIAEYAIPIELVSLHLNGGLCEAPFGIAVYHHWVDGVDDDYGWPSGERFDQPKSWQAAILTSVPCSTPTATATATGTATQTPTPTATPTATATATKMPLTATPTATATSTRVPSATPTATATATVTATPTRTQLPANAIPDLGDAPDSSNSHGAVMSAYPGVTAHYPTVYGAGSPPHGPLHRNLTLLFHLGAGITAEGEADVGPDADGLTNIDPTANSANRDGRDDGLVMPVSFPHCQPTRITYTVRILPGAPRDLYVNGWMDWDRSGRWGETKSCAEGSMSSEWAVQNQKISVPGPGFYTFTTPNFLPYNETPDREMWLRLTISESRATHADGRGPANGWHYGETEDYLIPAAPPPLQPIPYIRPVQVVFVPQLNPDLSIFGIEITQGVQCFDTSKGLTTCANNSLPVVAKKDTTARIYLRYAGLFSSSMNNVPVRLHIFANGVEYIANATGRATTTLNQANSDSANVYFNVNFSNDVNVSFYAVVDPNNVIAESNEGNNRFPATGTINLNFRKRDTMKIVGQRLRYHPPGYTGTQYAGGWAVNGGAASWFEQLLPIRTGGINYSVASGYLSWTNTLSTGDGQHALISYLNTQWILQNALSWLFGTGSFTSARHLYGWAPNAGYSGGHADMPVYPHAGGLGVVGIGTDAPGTSTDIPGAGALIFGHELVHDYNVKHTNTADACGSGDSSSLFPYSSSSIQEFGFNPITGKIYDPATTHDLMSYCPAGGSRQGWISPYTWNVMFGNLATTAVTAAAAEAAPRTFRATTDPHSLVINATIYNPDLPDYDPAVPGRLGDLYRIPAGVAYSLPAGDYAIQLRSGQTVLHTEPFTITFQSEYSSHGDDEPGDEAPLAQADVSFITAWITGTTSVALVHGDRILDQRSVSTHAPEVTIIAPTQEITWTVGSIETVRWMGSDEDGDSLTYALLYSIDQGQEWQLLASGITETHYSVEVDSLAGSDDARFRVVATDGVNIGSAETAAAIHVPNKAPMAIIADPADGAIVQPGALLLLSGSALDLEDGSLPAESLRWSSDRQGVLGIGSSLPLADLEPGRHLITLSVSDTQGATGTATISLLVGHGVQLPLVMK